MVIYDIDLVRWYLGEEVKNIYVIGGSYVFLEFGKFNDVDNGVVLIKFNNNKMGLFYVGRIFVYGYYIEIEIVGIKGFLRIGIVL